MSDKSLKEYAADIKELIQDGRSGEAIPMAQHLLRRFPRYLRGYRLLAEAALEQGSYGDAVEIFRRVLSADPEDLTAHAGLAATFAEEGVMDESLWHMMRAFEVEPRMQEVRDQLRYLYELRDGRAPGRLALNQAALARVYLREGMYDRAIEELGEALAEDPERVDLLASLAEAQWRAGQRQHAVASAHRLCLELPYCLKANLILGEFYAQGGDTEQAAPYLRIVQQLDPEHDVGAALMGESATLRPVPVLIEPLDLKPASSPHAAADAAPLPDWLNDLTLFTSPDTIEEQVDWEAIIAYEANWRTQLAKQSRDAIALFRPDWRVELRHATGRALGAGQPTPRRAPTPASPAPVVPPVAQPPLAAPALDWRGGLVGTTRAALAAQDAAADDWRHGLRVGTQAAIAALPVTPDWRLSLVEATRVVVGVPEASPREGSIPSWQLGLRAETERSLQQRRAPVAGQEPLPEPDLAQALPRSIAPEAPLPAAAPVTPAWIVALRAASEGLDSAPAGAPVEPRGRGEAMKTAPLRAGRRWGEQLRVDTELWLARWRRENAPLRLAPESAPAPDEEGSPEDATDVIEWAQELVETLKSEAGGVLAEAASLEAIWVDELREATLASIEQGEAPPALAERLVIGAGVLLERAQSVTETIKERAGELIHREEAPESWIAALREETRVQLPATNGGGHPLPERLAQGAGDLIERAQEAAGTLKEKATDSLSSLVASVTGRDDAPAEDPPAEAAAAEAGAGESEPEDELGRARAAWEAGQPREAVGIYQRLFYEGGASDEALSAALVDWTGRGEAPSLAYQLLGDLYRRMGRMQEAVVQYREAINRM